MIGTRPTDRNPRRSKHDRREHDWERRSKLHNSVVQKVRLVVDEHGLLHVSPRYPITPLTVVFAYEARSSIDQDRSAALLVQRLRVLAKSIGVRVLHQGFSLWGVAVTFQSLPDVAKVLLYYPGKTWVGEDGSDGKSRKG